MKHVQSVNLEWHKQEPGLLGLGRHCISDDGRIAAALRDNLAPRTYSIMQFRGSAHHEIEVQCGASFTMETVRRVETLPAGGFALAVTDHDLYFMNTATPVIDRTAYQPGRGMTFVDVALASNDPRRTFGILAVDRMGQNYTLSAAEGSDSLIALWQKTWVIPIAALAVSCDGEYFALGREDGGIILINRGKSIQWEHVPDESPGIAALAIDTSGRVVSVTTDGVVRRHAAIDGAIDWRLAISGPDEETISRVGKSTYCVATDAGSNVVGLTATFTGSGPESKQASESRYLLIEGDTGAPCWEDKLASPSSGISITPNGHYAAIGCRNGDLSVISIRFTDSARGTSHRQNTFQVLYDQAREAAERADFDNALRSAVEALKINPASTLATTLMDEATWQIRETAMADSTVVCEPSLRLVEHALSLIPYDERLTIRRNALARLLGERFCQEAVECEQGGNEEEAIDLFLRALDVDESCVDARHGIKEAQDRLVSRLFNESQSALAAQRYEEALGMLETIHEFRADEPGLDERIRFCRAALAFKSGMSMYNAKKYPQAAFQFKKAIALQPDHAEAARYLRFSESFTQTGAGKKGEKADKAEAVAAAHDPDPESDPAINKRFSLLEER